MCVCAKLNTIFARAKQKSFEILMRFFETKKYFRVSNPNSFRTENIFSLLSGGGQKKKNNLAQKKKKERKKKEELPFFRARAREVEEEEKRKNG